MLNDSFRKKNIVKDSMPQILIWAFNYWVGPQVTSASLNVNILKSAEYNFCKFLENAELLKQDLKYVTWLG